MIKTICIENVKGYGTRQCFTLDIVPNKPSILVAPNGFGKSSLTAAFNCLNANRMLLHKDHYHQDNEANKPFLSIEYKKEDGTFETLTANDSSNQINSVFDIFVINSKLEAKARNIRVPGGVSRATASMEIAPIELVKTIPIKAKIDYKLSIESSAFGVNGKILPNIVNVFNDKKFMGVLSEKYTQLDRSNNPTIQTKITSFRNSVNSQTGTTAEIKSWIAINKLGELRTMQYISDIAQLVQEHPIFGFNEVDSYLVSLEISSVYLSNTSNFKTACTYKKYELEKDGYLEVFSFFNATWKDVKPQEKEGSLILSIPKAKYISNGQRDVLTFIALLQQAKNKFSKNNCILIIDEVFDYLDDANLIAVQYYITQFIDKLKDEGKKFYPIILTHLNPYYFHSYAFSEKNRKVYFLRTSTIATNDNMRKLIEKRDNAIIKDDVAKYFLHYHNETINIRENFRTLLLKETWGDVSIFNGFIDGEIDKYIQEQTYCPFSVCIALRKKIEEKIFSQLASDDLKSVFIEKHGTPNKLTYSEENGVNIPEVYYLLGVIYNEVAHLKNYVQNNSPLINKLENLTIKTMIRKVFE
ncbi:MAG: hypothetical protein WC272_10705 [Sulfurimonas sp.]|jgi:hypothetical protein